MIPLNKITILEYAKKYDEDEQSKRPKDRVVEEEMKALLDTQRFLRKEDLVKIGLWKSPRQRKRYKENDDQAVRELTKCSFVAKSEQTRVAALLALRGVSYPVASAILHFAFPARYPILDFRVIESLGREQPKTYTFQFWEAYCGKMRKLAKSFGVTLRSLDKALWQYSKESKGKR